MKSSASSTTLLVEEEENEKKIMRPYRMSPETSLSTSCPIGTCFLGQAFVDNIDTGFPKAKIMIFDLIQIGQKFDMTKQKIGPSERYRLLREECISYITSGNNNNNHCVQIQWVGDRGPAESFCGLSTSTSSQTSSNKLPHRVDCIIGLSRNHPCNLTTFY